MLHSSWLCVPALMMQCSAPASLMSMQEASCILSTWHLDILEARASCNSQAYYGSVLAWPLGHW